MPVLEGIDFAIYVNGEHIKSCLATSSLSNAVPNLRSSFHMPMTRERSKVSEAHLRQLPGRKPNMLDTTEPGSKPSTESTHSVLFHMHNDGLLLLQ